MTQSLVRLLVKAPQCVLLLLLLPQSHLLCAFARSPDLQTHDRQQQLERFKCRHCQGPSRPSRASVAGACALVLKLSGWQPVKSFHSCSAANV
jgi:hypothetical protein